MQMRGAHQVRFPLRKLAFAGLRLLPHQSLAHHEAQNRITQKFQLLVVTASRRQPFGGARPVSQRTNQQVPADEMISELCFQSLNGSLHALRTEAVLLGDALHLGGVILLRLRKRLYRRLGIVHGQYFISRTDGVVILLVIE